MGQEGHGRWEKKETNPTTFLDFNVLYSILYARKIKKRKFLLEIKKTTTTTKKGGGRPPPQTKEKPIPSMKFTGLFLWLPL